MPNPVQRPFLGQRILVVEDELTIAMWLEEILLDAGCIVAGPAGRLDQALALAQDGGMRFALLDVNLRGVPVFPVADLLAARGVPFVFLTGYGRGDLPTRFATTPVLCKPFRANELFGLMARLFEALSKASPCGGDRPAELLQ